MSTSFWNKPVAMNHGRKEQLRRTMHLYYHLFLKFAIINLNFKNFFGRNTGFSNIPGNSDVTQRGSQFSPYCQGLS